MALDHVRDFFSHDLLFSNVPCVNGPKQSTPKARIHPERNALVEALAADHILLPTKPPTYF